MIVANSVNYMQKDVNKVTLLFKDGGSKELNEMSKDDIASSILDEIAKK